MAQSPYPERVILDLIRQTQQAPDPLAFLPELLAQAAGACDAQGSDFTLWAPLRTLAQHGGTTPYSESFPARNEQFTCGTLKLYVDPERELAPELRSALSTLASAIATRLLQERQLAEQAAILKGAAHDVRGAVRRTMSLSELAAANPELAKQEEAEIAALEKLLRDLGAYANALQKPAKPPARLSWPDVEQAVRWKLKALPGAQPRFLPSEDAVWAREEDLADVLFRLMENATTFAPHSPVLVSMRQSDGGAAIEVSDQGPGIEARYADQIFSPFFRLHGKQFPGHGLGLSICLRIVASHSGKILAVPGDAGGLTVRIWLPDCPV